jgi:hypothetical protein
MAMAAVIQYQKRLVKENLLGFGLNNIVLFSALTIISFVPIKARYFRQVDHWCILSPYTSLANRDRTVGEQPYLSWGNGKWEMDLTSVDSRLTLLGLRYMAHAVDAAYRTGGEMLGFADLATTYAVNRDASTHIYLLIR